jgi:undecaprenyl diphosphate synthase
LLQKIQQAENETSHFKEHVINLAIDYGGRDEILRAVNKILDSKKDKNKAIDELAFSKALDTGSQPYPDPDLIIRTSPVDKRLSGFMPWQSYFSELSLTNGYGPSLRIENLVDAILDFGQRKRTFGK